MTDSIAGLNRELNSLNVTVPGLGQQLFQGLCRSQLNLEDPQVIETLERTLNSLRIDTRAIKDYLRILLENTYRRLEIAPVTINVVDSSNGQSYPITLPGGQTINNLIQAAGVPNLNFQLITRQGRVYNGTEPLWKLTTNELLLQPIPVSTKSISVKDLATDKQYYINLPSTASVGDLKQELSRQIGAPTDNRRLFYHNRILNDTDPIRDFVDKMMLT